MKCETITSEILYEDRWNRIVRDDVRWSDGHEGQYTVVYKPPGISVIALTEHGTVILTREFRYALRKHCIEAVSGAIEANELPERAAHRELAEEIGFSAEKLTSLGLVHPFTAAVHSPSYLFLAEGLTPVETSPDPGEYIEKIEIPFVEAVAKVLDSQIEHAPTCLALLLVERHLASRASP